MLLVNPTTKHAAGATQNMQGLPKLTARASALTSSVSTEFSLCLVPAQTGKHQEIRRRRRKSRANPSKHCTEPLFLLKSNKARWKPQRRHSLQRATFLGETLNTHASSKEKKRAMSQLPVFSDCALFSFFVYFSLLLLWESFRVEKYRPDSLNQLVSHKEIIDTSTFSLDRKDF